MVAEVPYASYPALHHSPYQAQDLLVWCEACLNLQRLQKSGIASFRVPRAGTRACDTVGGTVTWRVTNKMEFRRLKLSFSSDLIGHQMAVVTQKLSNLKIMTRNMRSVLF